MEVRLRLVACLAAEAALQAFEDHASGRGAEVMREIGVYEEALRVRMEAVDAMEMEYEQRYGEDSEDWPELDEERLPPMPEPVDYPRPANMEEPNYRNGLGRLVLHMASLVGDQRTIEGLIPLFNDDIVPVLNMFLDHGTPLDSKNVVSVSGEEALGNGQLFCTLDGLDGLAGRDISEQGQGASPRRATPQQLNRARLPGKPPNESTFL